MLDVSVINEHIRFAFLCTVNRFMTKCEHYNCTEQDLFNNPGWLIRHYFENSGVKLTDSEKNQIEDFLITRNGRQVTKAFLCPTNRNSVKEEYGLSDDDFLKAKNYNKLIEHYIVFGGAKVFADKKEEFNAEKTIEELRLPI